MSKPHFGGKIGMTTEDSVAWWPSREVPHTTNVLLVVFDDTGWSDFGCYGSEIATPAIGATMRLATLPEIRAIKKIVGEKCKTFVA